MADEPDMLAGEYALGVLEGDELARARRQMLADPSFANDVTWWTHKLACMAEAAGSVAPSAAVWPAIERRLAALDEAPGQPVSFQRRSSPGLSGWNLAGAFAAVAAAAAAITLFFVPPMEPKETEPQPAPSAPGPRYVAQGSSEDGTIRLAGLIEPQANRLSLQIAGLSPGDGEGAELWVVPEGGAPVSLGLIPAQGSISRDITREERALLADGAVLAVTYEDEGSAPHMAPSSDILVVSPLSLI